MPVHLILAVTAALLGGVLYALQYRRWLTRRVAVPVRVRGASGSGSGSVEFRSLPVAPGPLPLPVLGNLHTIGKYRVPFEAFTYLAKTYGDVYSLTLGATPCLVVNSVDRIREVLNQNGKFFGGRPDFIRFHKLFGGDRNNSLALCDWSHLQQKRRNLARKHCSPRDNSSYYSKLDEVGRQEMEEFLNQLEINIDPGKDYHLKPLIMATCMNMFSQYMCSIRFQYSDEEFRTIVRCFDEIFWEINQGYAIDFLPFLLPFYSSHMKKLESWSRDIRSFILSRIIHDRERDLDPEEPEKDFTDALLNSFREDSTVNRETIIYMLEDFLGGHSAIGNLVMLALANVVRNPHVALMIQKEIDEVTEGQRGITLYDTEKMPYTVSAISETLRHSSSPIVPHVATENASIAGYGVEKGTIVFINNYELNTSEAYWHQPERFNPERFLERVNEEGKSMRHDVPHDSGLESDTEVLENDRSERCQRTRLRVKKNIPHFLPFSIGKRTCIGQNLVRGFSFIMFATIMQHYDVTTSDAETIRTYPACVAVPPDTFALRLAPRRTVAKSND